MMRMNEIHDKWASINVPHNPNHRQYVRCMACGAIWTCNEEPKECPYCGIQFDKTTPRT